ncbi:DUF3927 family protein [Escherichia albertii]
MSERLRFIAVAILVFMMTVIDFTSWILSFVSDGLLAGLVLAVLWPGFKSPK